MITSPPWEGEIFRISRVTFERWRQSWDVPNVVVYAVYEDLVKPREGGSQLYVGHSKQGPFRINNHSKEKDWWTDVVIFTSPWMNTAHAENIEKVFIDMGSTAGRYSVTNAQKGTESELGVEDKKKVDSFINIAHEVIALAGLDIFTVNPDELFTGQHEHLFHLSVKIVDAGPPARVCILAGGRAYVGNKDEVERCSLPGLVYDDDSKFLSFTQDVEIHVTGLIAECTELPNLVVGSLVNRCNKKLSHVLRRCQQERQ